MLLALEMDLVLATVALLSISTAILPRPDSQAGMELALQGPSNPYGYSCESQAKGKQRAPAWDNLPDLEFQSDNPHNDFKRSISRPMMLDMGTMTSPLMENLPQAPVKASLRQFSASSMANMAPPTRAAPPVPSTNTAPTRVAPPVPKTNSQTSLSRQIPPLPFSQSSGSLLETPAYPQRSLDRMAYRSSVASSTSSSSLSSGPFSEDEYDEAEEVILQAATFRPQSVVQSTRHASVAVAGRISSWGIHEVEVQRPNSK
jgi:hypothetical protein